MGMGNAFGTGSYGRGWWRVRPPGPQARINYPAVSLGTER
jgi:hypothetical protein